MKNKLKKRHFYYWIILTISLLCAGCAGNNRASTVELAKTEGTINVWDSKKDIDIVQNMKLYDGYHVGTKKDSYAWVLLDSTKISKLDVLSEIEIEKSGKELEILLNSGSIFFHVTEPLKEDETMNIRTSSMAVGIRGTCGWVEISDESHMRVCILEGQVACETENPASPEDKTVSVSAGESALITLENGKTSVTVTQMSEADIPDFVMTELEKNETVLDEARPFLQPGSSPEDVIAAYQNHIDTFMTEQSFGFDENIPLINERTGYELIYLNDDDIPECLVWEAEPNYSVSEASYRRLSILTFSDGNVQWFDSSEYGYTISFYYTPRSGRFYTEEHLGLREAIFWQAEEVTDNFRFLGTASQDSYAGNGTTEYYWEINAERVESKAALDEYINSFGCSEQLTGASAYRTLQEAYAALE